MAAPCDWRSLTMGLPWNWNWGCARSAPCSILATDNDSNGRVIDAQGRTNSMSMAVPDLEVSLPFMWSLSVTVPVNVTVSPWS